jgi:hypothetical protein
MFFPALLAKLLSAGAVAQAATGATLVVVAFAGAGAAGVLPGPVQDTFTSIVSDESEELPAEEIPAEEAPAEEIPAEEAPAEEAPAEDADESDELDPVTAWMEAPIDGSFGDWVSAARHDPELRSAIEESGHNFGYYVSQRAKQKGMTEEDLAEEGVDLGELEDTADGGTSDDGTVVEEAPEADAPEVEVEETEPTTQEQGTRGNGNGNRGGNGGGNGNGRN